MPLTPEHLDDLRKSGLSDATIAAAGLYSVTDPARVRDLLGEYLDTKTCNKMGPCLAFPYLTAAGTPMTYTDKDGLTRAFVRLKPLKPRADRKNKGKQIKYESAVGAPCRAYFPPGTRAVLGDPTVPLLLTEGEKKSLCADQNGFACVGLGGVWAWQQKRDRDDDGKGTGPRELIPDLDGIAWTGRTVFIVLDSDVADKPQVQWAEYHLAHALEGRGAVVRVVRLPAEPDGAKNGLDDYIARHGADALRALLASAAPAVKPAPDDGRAKIVVGTDQFRVNGEAVAALASVAGLYQRGGLLARVVRQDDDGTDDGAVIRRPPGAPVVRPLPAPLLRETLTLCARWVSVRETKEGPVEVPVHPPGWSVDAVYARDRWPGVPRLEAVVDYPVVLADGTILSANGYDRRSGLLVALPPNLRVRVPDRPTAGDATAAVAAIGDAIQDFPFQTPAHRAAWFAGLLAPLAWFAFEGPAPLLLIDGNPRGCGKGLLGDVVALTLTGRRFPVMGHTSDKEELRKKITTLAAEGERMVLLDNLAGAVGNDVLDMALTTDRWKDRLLSVNKTFDGPLNVCWFATGNNVQLHADTSRRCVHCRIETAHENPELRADVRYEDLRGHVRANRGPLLSAALTILRAWFVAGRPRHKLPPWGSFEGRSAVVREALVFAGLPDPGETRLALQTTADRDAQTMNAMIDVLVRVDPHRTGVTTAELVELVRKPTDPPPDWLPDLKSAVEELCGKLDGRALGYKFRAFARRNFGGRMIDRSGAGHGGVAKWVVVEAGTRQRAESCPPSLPSPPPTEPPSGGDGDDGGDVPPQPGPGTAKPKRRFRNDDREHPKRGTA